MRIVLTILGGLIGLVVGAAIGFGLALWVAKPRYDGTFGMREILVLMPIGALIGLGVGIWWGIRTNMFG